MILSGIRLNTLIGFYTNLGTMLKAGMSIQRGLKLIESQTGNSYWKEIITALAEDVDKGNPLSSGMKKYPAVFSSVQISLVIAAERAGTMDIVLKNISDYLERLQRIRRQITGGLVYPIIIFHIAVFLPNIVILIQQGANAYMRATLGFLIPVYLVIFLIYLAWKSCWHKPAFRNKFDAVLLYFPVLGGIAKRLSIANFSRSLSYLIGGGVSIIESLKLSADASGNSVIKNSLLKALPAVEKGGKIFEMLKKTGLFSEMVLGMVTVGEETGDIDRMLAKLTEYYEFEAGQAINRLVKIFPLIAYLAVACYVGYLIISFWVNYYSSIFTSIGI